MPINPKDIIISKFLPHKPPMLMVDRLLELSHQHVKTEYLIAEPNCLIENKVLTEFGLIEHAAQTCSSVVGQSFFIDEKGEEINYERTVIGFINSIKNLTLYSLPHVNQTLVSTANLVSKVETDSFVICTMKSETFCDEKLLLEADFNLIITERP